MLTQLQALTALAVVGSLLAGVCCAEIERRAGASLLEAFCKAALSALLVALPLPVLGTVLAGVALVWRLGSAAAGFRAQSR